MLRAVRNILHGALAEACESAADATPWRRVPFLLLLGALLVFGCFPKLLTERIKPSAALIVDMANRGNRNPPGKSPSGVMIVGAARLSKEQSATSAKEGGEP